MNNDREDSQSFLAIDKNRLDEEWLGQPQLYGKWAEKLADAKMDLEEAKAALELADAETDKEIRDDPAKFGLVKDTVDAVKAAIIRHERHIECQAYTNKCKHKVDVVQAYVNSLDHRKAALSNLVHLFSMDYFSRPTAPPTDRDRLEKRRIEKGFGKGKKRQAVDDE